MKFFDHDRQPPSFPFPSKPLPPLNSSQTGNCNNEKKENPSIPSNIHDHDRKPLIFFWADDEDASSSRQHDGELASIKTDSAFKPVEVPRKDLSVKGFDKIHSARIFARDVSRRRPVVYERIARRLIRNYELLSNYDRLMELFGHIHIPISVLQAGESLPPFRKQFTTFGDFLQNVRQSPEYAGSYYIQQLNLEKHLPQLIETGGISAKGPASLSKYLRKSNSNGPTLFIGAKGTRTSLHYDRSFEIQPQDQVLSSQTNPSNSNGIEVSLSGSSRKPRTSFYGPSSSNSSVTTTTTSSTASIFSIFPSSTSTSTALPHSSSHSNYTNGSAFPTAFPSSSGAISSSASRPSNYDLGKHNLFLQVSGCRRFILFPEECTEDLLPSKGTPWPQVSKSLTFVHTVLEYSSDHDLQLQFILNSPFPSLAKAWSHRVEVILNEGEALFIPARWWHCTEILQSGTGVNWWFLVDPEVEERIRQHTRIVEIPAELFEHHPDKDKAPTAPDDLLSQNLPSSHSSNSQYSYFTAQSFPSTIPSTVMTNGGGVQQKYPSVASSNGTVDQRKRDMNNHRRDHPQSNSSRSDSIRRKVYTDWDAVESNCPIS